MSSVLTREHGGGRTPGSYFTQLHVAVFNVFTPRVVTAGTVVLPHPVPETNRKTNKQTERQTNRKTNKHTPVRHHVVSIRD